MERRTTMKMDTKSQRYNRRAELRQNEAETADNRERCSLCLICFPVGLVCVCVCSQTFRGLRNGAKWLFVNDRRAEQKEELSEKRKGDEVVNYSGRRRRRKKHQGTLRGIPPLMILFLHLRHLGSYVTFFFLKSCLLSQSSISQR